MTDDGIDLGQAEEGEAIENSSRSAELQDKSAAEVEEIKEAKRAAEEQKPKYVLSSDARALTFVTADELAAIEELFHN